MNYSSLKLNFTQLPPPNQLSIYHQKLQFNPSIKLNFRASSKLLVCAAAAASSSSSSSSSPSSLKPSTVEAKAEVGPTTSNNHLGDSNNYLEETLEKVIYRWRFVTLLGVMGSLIGAVLCFIQGCSVVATSFIEHSMRSGKAIVLMVEAIDVYLLGTVMLVFGMGIYELFVSNLDIAKAHPESTHQNRSNLFGLFTLLERPRWLEIKSVNELKTKVGHVIVMLLLIGLLDKSKKAAINTPLDLVCFSASVLLCSGCLYLLSKLNG